MRYRTDKTLTTALSILFALLLGAAAPVFADTPATGAERGLVTTLQEVETWLETQRETADSKPANLAGPEAFAHQLERLHRLDHAALRLDHPAILDLRHRLHQLAGSLRFVLSAFEPVAAGPTIGSEDPPPAVGTISGRVIDSAQGEPIERINVDVWTVSGRRVGSAVVDEGGRYTVEVPAGTFFVATHNDIGFVDEIYDDLSCPGGSVFTGACDPGLGTPVEVTAGPPTATGIDFALDPVTFAQDR